MLLKEIFQNIDSATNKKLEDALEAFSELAMKYATGPTGEDRHKAYFLQIFEKNFRYGFFNQCVKGIEGADIEVKSLIPPVLWDYAVKHKEAKYDSLFSIA